MVRSASSPSALVIGLPALAPSGTPCRSRINSPLVNRAGQLRLVTTRIEARSVTWHDPSVAVCEGHTGSASMRITLLP